jgi:glyoxylate reductase
MRQKIYVTRAIPRPTIEALEAEHDVTVNDEDRALSPDELRRNVAGCAAIVSLLTDRIDGPLLDAAGPNCRIVANYAVGTNNLTCQVPQSVVSR